MYLQQLESICSHLWYLISIGVVAYSRAEFGEGSGPIWMDSVRCSGTETSLIDCNYDADTSEDSHEEDAGVQCPEGSCLQCMCLDHALRLLGSEVEYYNYCRDGVTCIVFVFVVRCYEHMILSLHYF